MELKKVEDRMHTAVIWCNMLVRCWTVIPFNVL